MKIPQRKNMNQHPSPTIVFDIETIAQNEERLLAIAPNFEPRANLKDEAKIAADIAEKKQAYIDRAALNWKTAQVVLIGIGDGQKFSSVTGDEADVLSSFFAILDGQLEAGTSCGGHNVCGFDLPMLVNRARALNVPVPRAIFKMRNGRVQWHDGIFDTLDYFSFGKAQNIEGNGVDDVARALGLPPKTASGSQFGNMWKNDRQAALDYNKNDVQIEIAIAKACGFKFNA